MITRFGYNPEFSIYHECALCRAHVLPFLGVRRRISSTFKYTEYLVARECPYCHHEWDDYERVDN